MKIKDKLVDWYLTLHNEHLQKYGENTVVMMEVGSFYEFYAVTETEYSHLKKAAQVMSIRITRKNNKKKSENITSSNPYMAGITSISFNKYLKMLLQAKYTIVKVDQVTEPPNPERKITKIYSPGVYDNNLELNQQDNYLLTIYIEGYLDKQFSIGLNLIDLNTGNGYLTEFHDKIENNIVALHEIPKLIHNYNPSETVIYLDNTGDYFQHDDVCHMLQLNSNTTRIYSELPDNIKNITWQQTLLNRHFSIPANLDPHDYLELGIKNHATISVILAILFADSHDSQFSRKLNVLKWLNTDNGVFINSNTYQQLDIINKNNYTRNASLFGLINFTQTAMGKRHLKYRLVNPTVNTNILNTYYDKIEAIGLYQESLLKPLQSIYDIDRIYRKLSLARLNILEFSNSYRSYQNISDIFKVIQDNEVLVSKQDLTDLDKLNDLLDYLRNLFCLEILDNYTHTSEIVENIFQPGVYSNIDSIITEINANKLEINDYHKLINEAIQKNSESRRSVTNVNNEYLKLETNSSGETTFKITKTRYELLKKLKDRPIFTDSSKILQWVEFMEKMEITKKKSEVVINHPILKKCSNELIYLYSKLKKTIFAEFIKVQQYLYQEYGETLLKISYLISELDVTLSNYIASETYHYTRPVLIENEISGIKAENLRHPLTERVKADTLFIANPLNIGSLDTDNTYTGIITGLNGVGKSIYIKSVVMSVIMAQVGMFVPADNYQLTVYHKIFTRIGNNDNLFKGQSTFYCEMLDLSHILKNADKKTLVIADELCSGSEQYSAQAILTSTIEFLTKQHTSSFFTTHFHNCLYLPEITNLSHKKFYHFLVTYAEDNGIIYERKLMDGLGPKLYGIEVFRHILKNNEFIDKCFSYRNKIINNQSEIKFSKYNNKVVVEKCCICQKSASYLGELHTHHIKEQQDADINGYIDYTHKNMTGNLVILCETHHKMVHDNKIKINGWKIDTNKGKFLDYAYSCDGCIVPPN